MEKKRLFYGQTAALDMIRVGSIAESDARAVLILTYSGSLLALGPHTSVGRLLEYASIEIRQDVPDIVRAERVLIAAPISRDAPRRRHVSEGTRLRVRR